MTIHLLNRIGMIHPKSNPRIRLDCWRGFTGVNVENIQRKTYRLSKILAHQAENFCLSRREAERLIRAGEVSLAGVKITSPMRMVEETELEGDALQLGGKPVRLLSSPSTENKTPRVWIAHKLAGELVTENDPLNRPSLLQRLVRGGVGKGKEERFHLKPVGRLDMPTEGLLLLTNDGAYSRQMELPTNKVHRTYRVRVHGILNEHKLSRVEKGLTIDGIRYPSMKVLVEGTKRRKQAQGTNKWLRVTCTEGKNRQIRKVFEHLGLNVNRLIRVSYGDYFLESIPPGMAVEVPYKSLDSQRRRGLLKEKKRNRMVSPQPQKETTGTKPIHWVRPC